MHIDASRYKVISSGLGLVLKWIGQSQSEVQM